MVCHGLSWYIDLGHVLSQSKLPSTELADKLMAHPLTDTMMEISPVRVQFQLSLSASVWSVFD
jgi:hypothetical protein